MGQLFTFMMVATLDRQSCYRVLVVSCCQNRCCYSSVSMTRRFCKLGTG